MADAPVECPNELCDWMLLRGRSGPDFSGQPVFKFSFNEKFWIAHAGSTYTPVGALITVCDRNFPVGLDVYISVF